MIMHLDATGRTITKGAYVAYSVASDSRSGIKFGAVVKLKQKETTHNEWDASIGTYKSVPKTEYTVSIIVAERSSTIDATTGVRSYGWTVKSNGPDKPAKIQSIERLDRMILLDASQMNPDILAVIDKELHNRGMI